MRILDFLICNFKIWLPRLMVSAILILGLEFKPGLNWLDILPGTGNEMRK